MAMWRSVRRFAAALALLTLAGSTASGATAPPVIRKPTPVPAAGSVLAPLPPAQFDPTLSIGGDDVQARKADTRLSVMVQVNGRGPYKFVVDSGADTSVVGLRVAQDLELPLGTPAILNGTTSRNIVDRVKIARLDLGPSVIRDLQVPALREVDLGGDGLIGIDALVRQRLMMDFEQRVIRIEDARTPIKHYPDEIVITARRQRGQLILTHVSAAGLPLDAVIDTGSELTIGNPALRDKLIRGNRDRFTTVEAIDVTGVPAKLQMATISELQLGPVILQNVPIAFADVPPFNVFGLSGGPALLLGTDILELFRRVSLDFHARKARFQLRRCGSQSAFISTISSEWATVISSTGAPEVCGRG
jgi:Aspartyl protease